MILDVDLLTRAIVFIINVIGLWLICLVYFSNTKRNLASSFILMTAFMLVWVDFAYIARLPSQINFALLWIKISWAVTIPLFASLYFFVVYFLKIEKKYVGVNLLVFLLGSTSFLVTLFTNLIIEDIKSQRVWTRLIYGDYVMVFYGEVLFLSVLSLFLLSKKYIKSDKTERLRIQYFFIGIVFFLFMNVVFNIVYPAVLKMANYYQLGDYSTVISISFIAYAITKKDLMGIKTFLTQSLIILMSAILLFDIFFLSGNIFNQILKSIVLIIFLYLSRELIMSVKKEKNARERLEKANYDLEERNKDLKILLGASDKVGRGLDSKKISQDIVDSIPESLKPLGCKIGVIALYDPDKDCVYVYAVTDSELTRKVEGEMGVSIKKFRERLSSNDDLTIKTIKNGKIYTGNKLEYFFSGFVTSEENKKLQKLIGARSFISVPLFASGHTVGAMVFASDRGVDTIKTRTKDILKAFSSHIGSAIENAMLYEKTDSQMKEVSKLNRSLKKANVKLKELLELKNEFLHITSHQLRTPLTSIRGMISMWVDGDFDHLTKKRKDEMLQRIYNSTERLNNLTNDMLDALELEGGVLQFEFKKVSLVDIIKDTIATLEPEYKQKGLYLKFEEPSKNIPEIEAEPNYMAQIFMNLIDNACKYTKEGGAKVKIAKAGKFVDVFVEDTGIGIEDKDRNKIFEKFTRGENAIIENASGSGLGLFIVKKIVEEHDGMVKLSKGAGGKGTLFKVSLPIKQEQ